MRIFSSLPILRLFVIATAILLFSACANDSVPELGPPTPPNNETEPLSMNQTVPQDGILETVTWNLKRYGEFYNRTELGVQRTRNVLQIADSLKADLYAFQEIASQRGLDSLTRYMPGYRSFVADHISYDQKLAFAYNTEAIDSLSAGAVIDNQDDYDWADRLPLYFSFNYNYPGADNLVEIYAIVIHAKANTGDRQEAYNRRKGAAESLYAYLQGEHPDAHILLLGDFNDDVDVSIYDDSSPSPYADFVEDEASFKAITGSISENGESSYIAGDYSDLIDHIIISDELFSRYAVSSEEIYIEAENFIENYEYTTSDHLPVWAKFDFTSSDKTSTRDLH